MFIPPSFILILKSIHEKQLQHIFQHRVMSMILSQILKFVDS